MTLNKPTLLIFTDWYTPGFKAGGPIQSIRNLVEALQSDFRIFVYTSDRDLGEQAPYPNVHVDEWTEVDNCMVFYSSPSSRSLRNYRDLITELQPRAVYLNSLFSLQFTLLPVYAMGRHYSGRVVLAPRGMLHSGALAVKSFKKDIFLKVLRLTGFFSRLHVHATDQQEYEDVLKHLPGVRSVEVIANFPSFAKVEKRFLAKDRGQLRLIYLARVAPNKNLSFLLGILKSHPWHGIIRLTIAGDTQELSYWALCKQLIGQLPASVQVEVRDAVPHGQVTDLLQAHHIFVLPTKGENFGHGIFEALLAGRPVLISDQTPWRNLVDSGLGWDIPLNRPEAFVQAIEQAMQLDQDSYNKMSEACREFALDYRADNEQRNKYIRLFTE